MSYRLKRIGIEGYKSFAKVDVELHPRVNVLIGANGSGKSNFLSLLRLAHQVAHRRLQEQVAREDSAARMFHHGVQRTREIVCEMEFAGYDLPSGADLFPVTASFRLVPTESDQIRILEEKAMHPEEGLAQHTGEERESHFAMVRNTSVRNANGPQSFIYSIAAQWHLIPFFHFADPRGLRRAERFELGARLEPTGYNLCAHLLHLHRKHPAVVEEVEALTRTLFPSFERFELIGEEDEPVRMLWRGKPYGELFTAGQLPDGILRFIACAAVALNPDHAGTVLMIDEVELGLHPAAIATLCGIIDSASRDRQFFLATQSPQLVDEFDRDRIMAFTNEGSASAVRTFRGEEGAFLDEWLEEYSLGQLWRKNVLGGKP